MGVETPTHTLEDLTRWQAPGKWLAIVGDPIAHSLSPVMHNAALSVLAQEQPEFADWRYVRFQIPAERLVEALPAFHAAGFVGLNLTLPHKVHAFSLVKEVLEEARPLGAVNTLRWTPQGYIGTNTDGHGLSKAVELSFGFSLGEREVVLFGAGGAARSIAVRALSEGCPRLWIGNRSKDRLEELQDVLRELGYGSRIRSFSFAELPADLPAEPLLINATSLGLKEQDPLPVSLAGFGSGTCCYDTTYGVINAWSRACAAHGFSYADGIGMLVWQGARSLEFWTGHPAPAQTMEAAARRALNRA